MDYVRRIIKDEPLTLAKRLHVVEYGFKTLCGMSLNERWYIVDKDDVTCKRCSSLESRAPD